MPAEKNVFWFVEHRQSRKITDWFVELGTTRPLTKWKIAAGGRFFRKKDVAKTYAAGAFEKGCWRVRQYVLIRRIK